MKCECSCCCGNFIYEMCELFNRVLGIFVRMCFFNKRKKNLLRETIITVQQVKPCHQIAHYNLLLPKQLPGQLLQQKPFISYTTYHPSFSEAVRRASCVRSICGELDREGGRQHYVATMQQQQPVPKGGSGFSLFVCVCFLFVLFSCYDLR